MYRKTPIFDKVRRFGVGLDGRMRIRALLLICMIQLFFVASVGQDSRPAGRKPVLIRADRTSDRESEVEVYPDPVEAERHIRVGDFYFKRKNFKAAGERYRQAVKYFPRRPDSYLKLVRALEKMEEFEEALAVCREFLEANPEASQIEQFQSRLEELKANVNP